MNEPSQRPTPETDEIAVLSLPLNYSDGYVRLRDHARAIERQRDEAREQVRRLREALRPFVEHSGDFTWWEQWGGEVYETARAILAETKEAE